MAEHGGGLHGGLTDAARQLDGPQHHAAMTSTEDPRSDDLSLEEILGLYSQPINEEQAWAVCYQCCVTLLKEQRRRRCSEAAAAARIAGPGDVQIGKDGSVRLHKQSCEGTHLILTQSACSSGQYYGYTRNVVKSP